MGGGVGRGRQRQVGGEGSSALPTVKLQLSWERKGDVWGRGVGGAGVERWVTESWGVGKQKGVPRIGPGPHPLSESQDRAGPLGLRRGLVGRAVGWDAHLSTGPHLYSVLPQSRFLLGSGLPHPSWPPKLFRPLAQEGDAENASITPSPWLSWRLGSSAGPRDPRCPEEWPRGLLSSCCRSKWHQGQFALKGTLEIKEPVPSCDSQGG